MEKYDVIIVGAGPGGYVCGIQAAKAGLRTAVVEDREVGGTCLNRGCIPAKAMVHASSVYREMKESEQFGVFASEVRYDYGKILAYKEGVTEQLCQGVEALLKGNGVTLLKGKGRLEKGKVVRVVSEAGETCYEGERIVLATGSKPFLLPIPGMELPGVLTSDELFRLREVPDSLVIIGGGVISVEFASVYANLGCKVTIVEAMARLLPNMEDREISQNLRMILKKRGVEVFTSAAVQRVEQEEDRYTCVFLEKEKEVRVSAQYVLCAVGRIPNTDGLLGEGVDLVLEKGRVVVDENFASSVEGVYAIGDLIKGMQLAHLSSAQGIYVAEHLAGKAVTVDTGLVPGCVYTDPEIAAVGITEEVAKEKGIPVKTGKFVMSANGKSLITKEERGFIKVVTEEGTQKVLGAQMMCARATDMIGEFVTAIANQMTADQMLKGMRVHPTYNEGVGEALEDAVGEAVHIMPKKKPQ